MQAVLPSRPAVAPRKHDAAAGRCDPFLVSAALAVAGPSGQPRAAAAARRRRRSAAAAGRAAGAASTGDDAARPALASFLGTPTRGAPDGDPVGRRGTAEGVCPAAERPRPHGPDHAAAVPGAPGRPTICSPAANRTRSRSTRRLLVHRVRTPSSRPPSACWPCRCCGPIIRPWRPTALGKLLTDKDAALRREASRTLALRGDKAARAAADSRWRRTTRNQPCAPMPSWAWRRCIRLGRGRRLLARLLDQPELRRDALRSLRGAAREPEVETALLAWWDKARVPTTSVRNWPRS